MSWYSYTESGIHPDLTIEVNLTENKSRLRLNDRPVYTGDCNGLLEKLGKLTETHGYDPDPDLDRQLDGQCFVCDNPVVPAIFHTTTCEYCDRNKQDLMDELSIQQRLIQGQSCVSGHYVCSDCYVDKRLSQQYVSRPNRQ